MWLEILEFFSTNCRSNACPQRCCQFALRVGPLYVIPSPLYSGSTPRLVHLTHAGLKFIIFPSTIAAEQYRRARALSHLIVLFSLCAIPRSGTQKAWNVGVVQERQSIQLTCSMCSSTEYGSRTSGGPSYRSILSHTCTAQVPCMCVLRRSEVP
ncbi:hypothetical protein EDD17DRAFT_195568 [Pisolithus thermaeus]|nr:hypothetical protein EDD17DRAFT_195568 [Pisolithus thermaeus]